MSSDLCIIIVLLIVLLIIFNRNIIEERFSDAVLRDLELSCSSVKVYPDRMVSQQYMYPEFTKGLDYIKNIGGGIGRDASGIGASLANSAADSMKMINIPNQEERDNYIKYGRELAGSISKKASGAASSIASKVPGAASNITGKAAGAATKISNKVGGVVTGVVHDIPSLAGNYLKAVNIPVPSNQEEIDNYVNSYNNIVPIYKP